MVNIVVRQNFGLEFLAKAKPLRPRPRPRTKITVMMTWRLVKDCEEYWTAWLLTDATQRTNDLQLE